MATTKKKKTTPDNTKKRLIVSYDKLPEADKELFEEKYEDGFMDYVKTVTRPDGTPMFVVPLETETSIYMVKIDMRVDTKMTDDEFDKEMLGESKNSQDDISGLDEVEQEGRGAKTFRLNHGDYESLDSIEEVVAKEDMVEADFTSLDDIDVADENSLK